MQKRGLKDICVTPQLVVEGKTIGVDLIAQGDRGQVVAICEPESVTTETENILNLLKDIEDIEVIIVHSQYGKPGTVLEKFNGQLETKKFRLLAVVPPPFDDVYEYDIWMFETTFRDLFTGDYS